MLEETKRFSRERGGRNVRTNRKMLNAFVENLHGLPAEDAYHCRGCGYNLTGNESGACPECGARPGVDDG